MKRYKKCRSPTDTVIYYCSLFNLFFGSADARAIRLDCYSNIVIVIVIVIVIGLSRVQFGL